MTQKFGLPGFLNFIKKQSSGCFVRTLSLYIISEEGQAPLFFSVRRFPKIAGRQFKKILLIGWALSSSSSPVVTQRESFERSVVALRGSSSLAASIVYLMSRHLCNFYTLQIALFFFARHSLKTGNKCLLSHDFLYVFVESGMKVSQIHPEEKEETTLRILHWCCQK